MVAATWSAEFTELGCNHVLVQVAMSGMKGHHLILSECVISTENNGSDRSTLGFAKMNHVLSKIEQR